MKKLLATALATTSIISFATAEQSFNISIDGYDVLTSVYSVQVEWMKSEDFSILAKPYFLNKSESGIDWSGYGLELAGRMYKGGIGNSENPYGIFLQYGIDFGYMKAEVGSYSDDTIYLGFNTKAGYRWIFSKHFTVDAGIGIGYYTSLIKYGTDDYRDFDGIELFGIISAGYSF